MSRHNLFMLQQIWPRQGEIITTELVGEGRISIAIGDFYVVTKLDTTESSTAHDRVGHEKAGAHDSVAPCCVTTEEARHARQTRLGVHGKPGQACTTSLGRAHQRRM